MIEAQGRLFILRKSFSLLIKNPVLFIPKLVIAILYGITTMLSVNLLKAMLPLLIGDSSGITIGDLGGMLFLGLILFLLTIFTYFFDIFLSGLYPVLVQQALIQRISFFEAFSKTKGRLFVLFSSGIIIWIVITCFSILEALFIQAFNFSDWTLIVTFIFSFIFIFAFYFLYPVIVFERKGTGLSISKTISSSIKNKKLVFIYSLIPFLVSIIKFSLAFFSQEELFLVLFWGLTIITGVIYALHMVVNQLLYLGLEKNSRQLKTKSKKKRVQKN